MQKNIDNLKGHEMNKLFFAFREREERLAVLNAQHQQHIQELQKKIQQKVRGVGFKFC